MQVEIIPRLCSESTKGFTMMELLVAVVLAGFLTASAFAFLGRTQSNFHQFISSYQRESSALLEEIRQVHPYQQKKRRSYLRPF